MNAVTIDPREQKYARRKRVNQMAVGLALAAMAFGLFWLAPVVWLGLFLLLRRADSPREAALSGLAFGLGFFLIGVS